MLFRSWKGTEKGMRLEREFGKVGVEIVYFPYTVHTSSTILRRALDELQNARYQLGKID